MVKAGHVVVGLTRNPGNLEFLHSEGVQPVLVDVFDREALFAVLREIKAWDGFLAGCVMSLISFNLLRMVIDHMIDQGFISCPLA
ncbi:hypothetical protein MNQ98_14010 [Paenibacillus sp. N3/727]|uniref:hypothetical protein n=1 Tax=Paenibacillus sp. N3/727 TaxID=2925845 RepID=UPI001F53164C|nr:hypothetical protein [Paenibacillus sp. N3/727]UNK21053.1 hypothetical protein MNQ98_14010 [Paenibacillus sp. N3/727]